MTTPSGLSGRDRGDQQPIILYTADWDAFNAALDAPPRQLPRLQRLLLEPCATESEGYRDLDNGANSPIKRSIELSNEEWGILAQCDQGAIRPCSGGSQVHEYPTGEIR